VTEEGLDALRARVHQDGALARRLRAIEPEVFVAEAARLAAEAGIVVSAGELEDAIAHGHQAWALRWIT
jgi:hypothetical protein